MRIKRIFSIVVCVMCLFLAVSCGANQGKANDSWKCDNCGKEASGNFCSSCGAARPVNVNNNSKQSNSSSEKSEQPKKSSENSEHPKNSSENSEPVNNDLATDQTTLTGVWFGQVESQSSSDKGKMIDVYLTINSDGTWISVENRSRQYGNWTGSGGVLVLTEIDSEGKEIDYGSYFGRLNGKYIFSFIDWYHYDVEMSKVEAVPISKDDLIGEWSGQVESQSSKGKMIDVYLTINPDGTWISVENRSRQYGNWTGSGGVLVLTEIDSEGKEVDYGSYFGRLNGKYIFSFIDWYHYDVAMTKQ